MERGQGARKPKNDLSSAREPAPGDPLKGKPGAFGETTLQRFESSAESCVLRRNLRDLGQEEGDNRSTINQLWEDPIKGSLKSVA